MDYDKEKVKLYEKPTGEEVLRALIYGVENAVEYLEGVLKTEAEGSVDYWTLKAQIYTLNDLKEKTLKKSLNDIEQGWVFSRETGEPLWVEEEDK